MLDFEGAGSSRSYKHPWEPAAAKESLATSGLYEASANVLWCNPWQPDGCDDPQVTMGEVRKCVALFQSAILSAGRADRITFPCVAPVVVDSERDVDKQAFNASLEVLTGHAYVQAWWYSMYKALDAAQGNDTVPGKDGARARAKMLLDCGRSATLHVRSALTPPERACWSIGISEARKNDYELSDTFVTFSRKAWKVIGDSTLTM